MRNALIKTGLTLALSLGSVTLVACAHQTEGEKTLEKSDRLREAGNTITRGEQLIADGKALEARGVTIRDQGQRIEGEGLIAEGKAKQQQGQTLIDEGKKMRD